MNPAGLGAPAFYNARVFPELMELSPLIFYAYLDIRFGLAA
jgi:hypothetical protein